MIYVDSDLNLAQLLTQKKPDDSTPGIEAEYKTNSHPRISKRLTLRPL